MTHYKKLIEYCSNLPLAKSYAFKVSKKSTYKQLKSHLDFNLLNRTSECFVRFYKDHISFNLHKSESTLYSHLAMSFNNYLSDFPDYGFANIPLKSIEKKNIDEIINLIKKSYDFNYNKDEDNLIYFEMAKAFEIKNHDTLDAYLLEKIGYKRYADFFQKAGMNTVFLVENIIRKAAKGESKLGGNPDLPLDFKWPHSEEKPLTFLGQINLSQIDRNKIKEDIPKSGFLYFFSAVAHVDYDTYEHFFNRIELPETNKVYYFESNNLKRQNNYYFSLKEIPVDFRYYHTYPLSTEEPIFEQFDFDQEEKQEIINISRAYLEGIFHFLNLKDYRSIHTLFGYEQVVHDLTCFDKILFQTSTSENTGMEWGDEGFFYFHIPEYDLKKLDFSNIHCDNQCG